MVGVYLTASELYLSCVPFLFGHSLAAGHCPSSKLSFFIAHRCWSAFYSSMSTSTYLNNNISTNIPITIHASFIIASKHGYRMNSDTDIERIEKRLAKASLCIVEATIESVKIMETLSFRRSVRLFSGLSLFTFVFFISC